MTSKNWVLLLGLLCWAIAGTAQRDDILSVKEKKEFAFSSIKELKDGAIVVRLKTNHRKIKILENTLKSLKITDQQRNRHQRILNNTVNARDQLNKAISDMFLDSFTFCPVYLMYDTCSLDLTKGVRKGIFLNENKQLDTSITLSEKHIFLANHKRSGSDFPFDVLRLRKLKENLTDPFPYFVSLRESWIDAVNTPRAEMSVQILDRRLHGFYAQGLDYDIRKKEKEEKRASKKKEKTEVIMP
jgi:hypothetical protein